MYSLGEVRDHRDVVLTGQRTLDGTSSDSVGMIAAVDEWLAKPDPTKPTTQLLKKPQELLGLSISLGSLTLGYGWMTEKQPTTSKAPDERTAPQDTLGTAVRSLTAYFRKNSATLEGANLSALEEALAVERAIFVSRGGHARAVGHTSPEGPDNVGLAQRRADHVVHVIQSAFGKDLATSALALGYGDTAARAAGLIRPEELPAPPAAADKRALYRRQQATIFPQFRVVMLWVNGVLLIETRVSKAVVGG
jgi:outer membrane protein OmpA-like peptidoglycan-associated protein